MQWLDGLGDSAISPTNPLTKTQPVNPDGSVTTGGSAAMSGFTILEAESIDAALVAARYVLVHVVSQLPLFTVSTQ